MKRLADVCRRLYTVAKIKARMEQLKSCKGDASKALLDDLTIMLPALERLERQRWQALAAACHGPQCTVP